MQHHPSGTTAGALPAAVLFDMDGLLVDTESLWFQAEMQIMVELGGDWARPSRPPWSAARWSEPCAT